VSAAPYASFNLGDHVGDDLSAVAENRRRLLAAAALPAEPAWLAQVHGTRVVDLDVEGDFDAVADLCELSARQDPSLKHLTEGGAVKIAACFPRAVKWLFHTARADLPLDGVEVLNMRVQNAEEVAAALFSLELKPNLPRGKAEAIDAPKAAAA